MPRQVRSVWSLIPSGWGRITVRPWERRIAWGHLSTVFLPVVSASSSHVTLRTFNAWESVDNTNILKSFPLLGVRGDFALLHDSPRETHCDKSLKIWNVVRYLGPAHSACEIMALVLNVGLQWLNLTVRPWNVLEYLSISRNVITWLRSNGKNYPLSFLVAQICHAPIFWYWSRYPTHCRERQNSFRVNEHHRMRFAWILLNFWCADEKDVCGLHWWPTGRQAYVI